MLPVLALLVPHVHAQDAELAMDRWDTRAGLPQNSVNDVAQDAGGFLWIATFGGIVRFDGFGFTVFDPAGQPELPSNRYLTVEVAPDGDVWFGTEANGLVRFDGEMFTPIGPELGEVHGLTVAADGGLRAVTTSGYFAVDGEGQLQRLGDVAPTSDPGNTVVWGGEVWRVEADGLVGPDGDVFALPGRVQTLFEDREAGLWVGFDTAGLARIRQLGVRRVTAEAKDVTRAPDGSIVVWACEASEVVGDLELGPWARTFCGTGRWIDDQLWLAGGIDGVPGLHRVVDGRPELVHAAATQALFDGWAVLDGRVLRITDGQAVGIHGLPAGLQGIRADGRDAVWVSDGERLLRVTGAGIDQRVAAPSPNMPVRDVLSVDGGVWVSTYGGGLHWSGQDGRLQALTVAEGLCDNAVSRILQPGDGALWLNTNRGVGRVGLADLAAWRDGNAPLVRCELVESGEANGPGGIWTGQALILPTIRGAVEVVPSEALSDPVRPSVHIERATCGERAIGSSAVVEGPCALSVQWTGVSFDDPQGLRFRHRILGISDAWSPLSKIRELDHLELPVGRHRLEVQARSSRGVWSDVAAIGVTRSPIWSETLVGRAALPLGVAGVVLLVLLVRIQTERRQNDLLRRQVQQRIRAERIVRAEQESKREVLQQLEAARRLEAIGRLAGGVAHDFNNLLMVVRGRVEHIRYLGDGEIQEEADLALEAADQAAELTAQLLAFGRRADNSPEILDLSASIEVLLPVLVRLCEPMRVSFDLAPDARVRLDRTRLQQLVSNVCVNARDANASLLRVSTRRLTQHVVLEVQDDGDGMPPEVIERVFEPYFTTKTASRGTGLGMATVHGVIEEAGGTIEIQSELALGTRILITLPRQAAPLSEKRKRRKKVGRLEAIEVLLVDDDEAVRGTVAAQLEALGATVSAVASGGEALRRLQEKVPDLLITDVLMPEISGPELVAALRARNLVLPSLYISGHTGESLGLTGNVLRKPFSIDALALAVLEAVGRRTPAAPVRRG